MLDQDFMKEQADKIQVGNRCKVLENGHRGEVKYVGKVNNMGLGFFVGIKLDEPYGKNNGAYLST